jgi:MprA protease rhombosortase-interaction domain-containing protein
MGRKRRSEDQVPEHNHEVEHEHRSRRGRKLAVLLAVAGGAAYALRRNQRKAELDEGIWHEAPTPTSPTT